MLYHGPVRVPAEARPGKAVVRVELAKESQFQSLATDIEVDVVKSRRSKSAMPNAFFHKVVYR